MEKWCPAAGFSSEEESGDLSHQKMRLSSEKEATMAPSSATAPAHSSQSRTMPRHKKKKRELVQILTKRPADTSQESSRKKARSLSSSSLRRQCLLWNPSEHLGHSSSSVVLVDEPQHAPSFPPHDQSRASLGGEETGTIRTMLDGPFELLSERNLRAHTESVGLLGYDPMERLGLAGANNRSHNIHHPSPRGRDSGMVAVAATPGSDCLPARTILPLRETAKADTPMESPSSLRPLRLPDLSRKDEAPGKEETTKRCLFPTSSSSSSHVVECVDRGAFLEATTTGVTDAVAEDAVMLPQQKEQWNPQEEPEILPAVSTRVVPRSISAVSGADALTGLVVVCDENQIGRSNDPAKKKEAPTDKTVADFFRQRLARGGGRPPRDDGDNHNNAAGPSSSTVASFLRHRLPSPPSTNGLISQEGPTKSNHTILPTESETFHPSSNPSMEDGKEDTRGGVRAFAPTKRVAPSKKKKKKATSPAVISTRSNFRTLPEAPLPRRRGSTKKTKTLNTTRGMVATPVSPEPMVPAVVRTLGRRPSNNHRVSFSMMVFAAWSMLTWQTAVPPTTTMTTGGLGKTSFHPALIWKNAVRIDQGPSHDALKASAGMTEN